MIQLSGKNKVLIISLGLIFLVIIIFLVINLNKKESNLEKGENTIMANGDITREMSEEERTEKAGIVEEAEVVNEQDGLYIYKIKK